MKKDFKLSIIIPTHNRSSILAQCLQALNNQEWSMSEVEVLVIADDCIDDTQQVVNSLIKLVPYTLRYFSHSARSPSATRNLGVSKAQSQWLLFLDDDILASPGLIRAHLVEQEENQVILGYSKPVLPEKPSFWQYNARLWWEDIFREMRTPGYRFGYRDFFSGNVSMHRSLFERIGGYDTSMTGRLEDYELGYRLIAAGAKFKFNLHAIGYHHDKTNLDIWLSRIRQEGVANIRIADRHPDLRNQLFADAENRESQWSTTRTMIRNAAFGNLLGWDLVATMFLYLSHFCERLKLRGPWFHITGALREYQYWRGVREAIGNKDNLAAWLQEAPMPRPVSPDAPRVDCMHYPSDDELDELLSKAPVQGFRLTYRGVELFSIPPYAGLELLRKNHIKYFLLKMCGEGFNPVLALNFIETSDRIGFLCESNLLK